MDRERYDVLLKCFGQFSDVTLQLDWAESSSFEEGSLIGWLVDEPGLQVEFDEFSDVYVVRLSCEGEVLKRRHACALAWVDALRSEVSFPWVVGDVEAEMGADEDEGDGQTQVRIFGPSLGASRPPELHRLAFDAMRFIAEKLRVEELPLDARASRVATVRRAEGRSTP